jgi:hypothetical protein
VRTDAEIVAANKVLAVLSKRWRGEELTGTDKSILAYGYTAGTCGQKINLSGNPSRYGIRAEER